MCNQEKKRAICNGVEINEKKTEQTSWLMGERCWGKSVQVFFVAFCLKRNPTLFIYTQHSRKEVRPSAAIEKLQT